jgi:DNA-binding SARP family transcriptional activator
MARLNLSLLGGFELRAGARPRAIPAAKTRALLAYLALHAGRPQSRDALAALLWGARGDQRAGQSLRQALFRLRQALAAAHNRGLIVRRRTVTLERAAVDVDVGRFERLVRCQGHEALETAAALYRGPLLEGLSIDEPAFDDWFRPERERLQELAREALTRLLRHHTRRSAADAGSIASRLLALDPLREDVHRTLMRLYARQGRRDAALRQYQTCVELLRRELGVEPEQETQRLYQEVLKQQFRRASRVRPGEIRTETPLVGRESELARLRAALADAGRGQGRAVILTGETGVGKSRLVEELAAEAARIGARLLLGHCHETEQILPFRPWIDALRAGQVLADLKRLRTPNPVWIAELARLFPELAAAGPALPASSEGHVRLFDVVAEVVGSLATAQPLLLVLEDAHWADDMSLRLLSFLVRRLEGRPIVVVATAREEELDAAPVLRRVVEELARESRAIRLTVPALSQPATVALVRALARRGSSDARIAELAAQAWTLSEGNPLVIVETMRGAFDGRVAAAGTRLKLPQAVRDVITARLERLSPRGRQLAAVAATIGREFSFALLQRAAGLGERDTAEGVEELVRCRMLGAVDERFDFTHHRVRAVVYEATVAPRRVALHAAVGHAVEGLFTDRLEDVCDQLARHFSLADEAGRAFRYLLLLADKAARSYALDDAVRALRDAQGCVDRLPADESDRRRLDVTFRLAHVLFLLGRVQDALDLLLKEETRIEALHDPSLSGQYHFWLGYSYALLGEGERAVRQAQRSVEEAARCGDQVTMGRANYVMERESYYAGRPLQGIAYGRQAVTLLEATDERWWLGQARIFLAQNLFHLGDFTPALEELERLRELSASLGERRLQAFAAGMTGWINALAGESEAASEACRAALDFAPDPVTRALVHGYLGGSHNEAGDAAHAVPVLEGAIELFRTLVGTGARRYRQLECYYMAMLAEAYLIAGRVDAARRVALEATAMAEESGWLVGIGYSARALGRIAQTTGALEEAAECFDRALAAFSACEARYHVARVKLLRAEVAHDVGDRGTVTTHLRAAHDAFRLLRVPRYVARVEETARRFAIVLD